MNTMANVLDKEMFNYFTRLNEAEKKSVLQMLKTFLKGRKEKDEHISIEQYNRELEEADAEIESGNYVKHEAVKKMFLK